jgi:hypothetical protein
LAYEAECHLMRVEALLMPLFSESAGLADLRLPLPIPWHRTSLEEG